MLTWGTAAAALLLTGLGVLAQHGRPMLFALDDSDMKIAPAYPSRTVAHESNEFENREFLRHRQNGNLERAEKLAQNYAQLLFSLSRGSVQEQGNENTIRQECILFAFIMRETLRDYPAPVVGAKIQQEFNDLVFAEDPALFSLVTDLEATTLYTLCAYEPNGDERMGATFAKLCDRENDPAFVMLGSGFVARYRKLCADLLRASGFLP